MSLGGGVSLKITAIDPFSVKEDRIRVTEPKEKPLVQAPTESELETVRKEERGDKLLNIIEAAQQRAKKRKNFRDHRRRQAFDAYTLVLKGGRTLHEKGKKLDTRV
jgi:hypothetical protein